MESNNRSYSIIQSPNQAQSVIRTNDNFHSDHSDVIHQINNNIVNDVIFDIESKALLGLNTDEPFLPKNEMEHCSNSSIVLNVNNKPIAPVFSGARKCSQNATMTPSNFLNFLPNSNLGGSMLGSNFFPGTPLTPSTPAESSGIIPQIQNIVATVNLYVKLDLKRIALNARNAEYNPKRFAAVIMRIREPRTTALIFSSGKMVCTGAKSEDMSKLAARKYARIIQKLGFDAQFQDFKIQNMVGSCDVKFPIRLEGLVLTHSQFCSYEPELFPGLIYRMIKPRIVLLIFVSGKIVLTGAKIRAEIYQAFENIYPILKGFRKS